MKVGLVELQTGRTEGAANCTSGKQAVCQQQRKVKVKRISELK